MIGRIVAMTGRVMTGALGGPRPRLRALPGLLTCPYCKDLVAGPAWICPACATPHHADCREEHGRCCVLACAGTVEVADRAWLGVARAAASFLRPPEWVALAFVVSTGVVVALNLLGYTEPPSSRIARARADLGAIGAACRLHHVTKGRWPAAIDDLFTPSGASVTGKPELVDPWGRRYRLVRPEGGGPPDVFTLGADGAVGGEGEAQDLHARPRPSLGEEWR